MPPDAQNPEGQKIDTPPIGGQPVVEDPKWLAAIGDEGLREEAKKAWMKNEEVRLPILPRSANFPLCNQMTATALFTPARHSNSLRTH